MTPQALKRRIRRLTKWIGSAKRRSIPDFAHRLRIRREQLIVELARHHDLWTLINPEGRTEFLSSDDWKVRVTAWKFKRSPDRAAPPAAAPESDPVREFYGDPVSTHSRAKAIEDGDLVDVTAFAKGIYRYPVAFTHALWSLIESIPDGSRETLETRARAILVESVRAIPKGQGRDRITVISFIETRNGLISIELVAVCGPGDDAKPVVTIGFASDF